MSTSLLQLTNVNKSFFGVPVLRQVSMVLKAGTVMGLVGENGAGKSTLMNIIGGSLTPDAGELSLRGKRYVPQTPRNAQAAGIAYIHQELNLFPNLTIAENLFLTHFPSRFLGIDRRQMRRLARELLDRVGLDVSPNLRLESLSAGERQLVEIAKALQLDARLMILDEPTTSLTSRETQRLFDLINALKVRGISMIYISHSLGDVQELCDELVVLRDGRVVGHGSMEDFDSARMVSLMVGREFEQQFPQRTAEPTDEVMLELRNVSQPGVVKDVSFRLHRGEVLGVAGLMGSGRTELARILYGLDPLSTGEVTLAGRSIIGLSTRERIRRGMAMLTESRREDGLCMQASIRDNMSLVSAPKYAGRLMGMIDRRRMENAIRDMRVAVKLTPAANNEQPVQTLSGGNQQKVVLGKWLMNDPQMLILDEPTRGIDVGARSEIYALIDQLAAGGAAVLVVSSEIEELIGIADRILVMSEGQVRDELFRDEFSPERIMRSALRSDLRAGDEV